jgi:hypothetical protein
MNLNTPIEDVETMDNIQDDYDEGFAEKNHFRYVFQQCAQMIFKIISQQEKKKIIRRYA